ncbi:MAG: TrmB family transcriptional regulator [Deltaproteobacteria bacterium]|jgi:sugar-specific transcriptional regulator TrmB|nr:TrmB family transcriptional regulator [Deltaproteobacteria bacterium]MBW2537426.1 TrmB family transcriptional regulator [Deltaproteobacteria bacterium]
MKAQRKTSSDAPPASGRARKLGARAARGRKQAAATGAAPAVTEALMDLGFNRNEGRAYAALLQLGAATGYEVGQRSAVPRSAVYSVLRRLAELGAVRSIPGHPERFVATPAEALLSVLEKRFSTSEQALREAVRNVDLAPTSPDAFSVEGYERVLEEATRIAGAAERTLVLSGWPRELSALAAEVDRAHQRGVYVVIFSHAAIPETIPGVHFSHALDESELGQFWEHRLVLVADGTRTLLGTTDRGPADGAVLSEKQSIAEFAVGHVALDITLFTQRHGYDASAVMGRILDQRVGRLDELLAAAPEPILGLERSSTVPA